MGATPPARYALRRGGEGSVACSVARKPARPRGSLPSKLSLREGCAASRSGPRPRPWAWTRSAPVSFLEDALSRVSPGLLYALVAALSVELAAVSLLDFPAFGLVPILDLVSIETPRFYAVIRAWYYLAPACVVFAASLVLGELATRFFSRGGRVAFGRFHDAGMAALEALGRALSWRVVFSLVAGIAAYGWAERVLPFPRLGENPILDLVALEDPLAYYTIRLWCLAVPGLAAFGGGLILSGSWRVWLESRRGSRRAGRGTLPRWPAAHGRRRAPARARRTPPPDRCEGGRSSAVAHPAGAGALYRDSNFRRRGLWQDVGLYAPLRPANLPLAGG